MRDLRRAEVRHLPPCSPTATSTTCSARLTGHLAEMAWLAAPEDREVLSTHADVYETRRDRETSTMSKGVFGAAARDPRRVLDQER